MEALRRQLQAAAAEARARTGDCAALGAEAEARLLAAEEEAGMLRAALTMAEAALSAKEARARAPRAVPPAAHSAPSGRPAGFAPPLKLRRRCGPFTPRAQEEVVASHSRVEEAERAAAEALRREVRSLADKGPVSGGILSRSNACDFSLR